MREIIIASQNPNTAAHIRALLQSARLFSKQIHRTGAEVLAYASIRPAAVVICAALPDMTAATLAKLLPNGYDVLWLMPSGAPSPFYLSNLIPLNAPVNRMEFLDTVQQLVQSGTTREDTFTDDKSLLIKAKEWLMQTRGWTEDEAHKALQKRSMQTGTPLLELAAAVLDRTENLE